MPTTIAPLSDAHHAQFMALAVRLSPENLHCDGEISPREADRRFRALMKQWRLLEREVGRPVEESELWARDRARADAVPLQCLDCSTVQALDSAVCPACGRRHVPLGAL